jgi:aspartate/methionine/tyrosine aminotransferase
MYVFPQIHVSQKVLDEAHKLGKQADDIYCQDLLNEVGVIVLPGNIFG